MANGNPSDSTATGTVTTVAGSLTETGTVTILTRGTNQSSEQIQTPSGFTSVYSQGRASRIIGGSFTKVSIESAVTSQSTYFPLPLLVAATANPDFSFKYIGLETLNGTPVRHVQFWNTFASISDLQPLANFSVRDVWLDSASGLPRRFSFTRRSAGGSSPGVVVDVVLSDYRNVTGVLYPFSIQVSLNGTPWATIAIQNVTLNSGLSDSSFPVQ